MRLIFQTILLTLGSFAFSQNSKPSIIQMEKILKEISIKAIELGHYNSYLNQNQLDSVWIGYEPATVKQIDSLEQRLNIKLPQDYKDFLLLTNGFHAASSVEPSFSNINAIDFLMNVDPELYEIWKIGNPEVGEKLKTAIKVGGFDEEQYFFLIPPSNENSNWEYWFFAAWAPGEAVYKCMDEYLKNVLETTITFCNKK